MLLKWLDERTTVQKKERLVRVKTEVLEKSDQLLAIVSQKLKETNKYFGTETLAENMCLLCKKHKVSIIFMNCGHAIVCQFCVKHIKQICILCKNRIQYSIFATPQEISEVVDRKTLALSADKTISVEDTDVSEQEVQEFVTKLDLFADNDHLPRPREPGLNSPIFNVSNRDMRLTDDFKFPKPNKNYNTRADSPFSYNDNQASPEFKPPQKLPNSKTLQKSAHPTQALQNPAQSILSHTQTMQPKKSKTGHQPTQSGKIEIEGRRDFRLKSDVHVTISDGLTGFDNGEAGRDRGNGGRDRDGYVVRVKTRSEDGSSESGIEERSVKRLDSVEEESGSTSKVTVVSRKDVWSGESVSMHSQKGKKRDGGSSGGWY